MAKFNLNKGLSIIESLVCLVIIGIGFIAVSQLTSFAIGSMDRSMERTKVNFLSEMIIEDMMGDPDNATNYSFNETCTHNTRSESKLSDVQKNKWRNKLKATNQINIDGKDRTPKCYTGDKKQMVVQSGTKRTSARLNFFTGGLNKQNKHKRKKYLGVVLK